MATRCACCCPGTTTQPWCSCGSTRTPCPGRWASATGANDDGGEDMKPATGCIIAATLALAFAVPSAAVEVANLDAFQQPFGRYAPGGDCGKQPQIVVSHRDRNSAGEGKKG